MERKRHLVVDGLGMLLDGHFHSVAIQDRDGAQPPLLNAWCLGWLRGISADGTTVGQLVQWVRHLKLGRRAKLEVISKISPAIQHMAKRWVIERAFAWVRATAKSNFRKKADGACALRAHRRGWTLGFGSQSRRYIRLSAGISFGRRYSRYRYIARDDEVHTSHPPPSLMPLPAASCLSGSPIPDSVDYFS